MAGSTQVLPLLRTLTDIEATGVVEHPSVDVVGEHEDGVNFAERVVRDSYVEEMARK